MPWPPASSCVVVTALLVALAAWLTRDTGERAPLRDLDARDRHRPAVAGRRCAIAASTSARWRRSASIRRRRATCWCGWRSIASAPMNRDTFATLNFQGVTGIAFVQLDDSGKPAPPLPPDDQNPPRIPLQARPAGQAAGTRRGHPRPGGERDAARQPVAERRQPAALRQRAGEPGQRRGRCRAGWCGDWTPRCSNTGRSGAGRSGEHAALGAGAAPTRSARTADDFGKTARRLNAKDGPIDRLAEGTEALSHAADSFNAATLPRINRVTEETSRAVRQLRRTANAIGDNPQSLIYGTRPDRARAGRSRLHCAGSRPVKRVTVRVLASLAAAALLAAAASRPTSRRAPRCTTSGPASRQPQPAAATQLAPLVLADVEASSALDGVRRAVPASAYADAHELRPYANARWSAPPPQLVRQRLREQLGARTPGARLERDHGAGAHRRNHAADPARAAGGVLAVVRARRRKAAGLLRLRATLMDNTRGRRTAAGAAQRRRAAAGADADAPGGVRALTAATDAAAAEIAQWLRQQP